MSNADQRTLARGAEGRPAADSVLPRRLHAAARSQCARPGQPARDLHAPLPRGGRHAARLRARSAASGRHDRRSPRSSTRGARRSRNTCISIAWSRAAPCRQTARGGSAGAPSFLFPVKALVDGLPGQVSRRLATGLPRRRAHFRGRHRVIGRSPSRFAGLPRPAPRAACGRLCETALRRPRTGARLPRAVHASRRPLQ